MVVRSSFLRDLEIEICKLGFGGKLRDGALKLAPVFALVKAKRLCIDRGRELQS